MKFPLLTKGKMVIKSIALKLSDVVFMFLMPRLHLPYDEYKMPVRCPNHRFPAASAGRPCNHHPQEDLAIIIRISEHRGLYDFV